MPARKAPTARAKPAPDPAAEFTADDPPPRRRPDGLPAPSYLAVPPGETALAHYLDWDRGGRIPAGSVLCEFVGTDCCRRDYAYLVAHASPSCPEPPGAAGAAGSPVSPAAFARLAVRCRLVEDGRQFVILVPKGAA